MTLTDLYGGIRHTDAERALIVVAEHDGDVEPSVNTIRAILGEQAGSRAYWKLKELGLIERDTSLAAEAVLTEDGRRLAQYIMGLRGRGGPARNEASRRAVLQCLAENAGIGSLDALIEDGASAFGVPFSRDEIDESATWLRARGLIESVDMLQQDHIRPSITADGREVLVASVGSTIDEYVRRRSTGTPVLHQPTMTQTITNHGTIGAAQLGHGNHATVTQAIPEDNRRLVLAKIDELERLPETQTIPGMASAVSAIRSEAQKQEATKDGVLAKVGSAFGTAVGSGMGQRVVDLLGQIPQLLP